MVRLSVLGRATAGVALAALVLAGVGAVSPATAAVHVANTPEPSWQVNGVVRATAIVDDLVFIGGNFRNVIGPQGQTQTRRHLAAFSLQTGDLLSWRVDASGPIKAMATDGTSLYVAGTFSRLAGQTHSRVGKIDIATATVDPVFQGSADSEVRAIEIDSTGAYLGGSFSEVSGFNRPRMAKVELDTGALIPEFDVTVNGPVWGIRRSPTMPVVYLSGRFDRVNGSTRTGVGAVDATTGATVGPAFERSARPTLGLDVSDDGTRLFGAGGSGTNSAAAWDTGNGDRVWRHVTEGDIQAIAYHDGEVYFGFHDGYQGDSRLKLLASDAMTGELDPDFQPRFDGFWGVYAISASAGGLAVGGDFNTVSGVAAEGWARFPPLTAPPPPPPPPPPPDGDPVTTEIVSETDAWSWYYGQDPPPAAWNTLGFDDSAWAVGPAPLGFGNPGPINTDIDSYADPLDRPRASYYRHGITLDDASSVVTLELTTIADDGVVVYVNGAEVGRENMPAGTVDHWTYAPSAIGTNTANANPVTFSVPPQLLQDGDNVIAAETHLNYRRTRNLSFKLSAELTVATPTG